MRASATLGLMNGSRIGAALGLLVLMTACGVPPPVCTPGVTQACLCAGGGSGVQACEPGGASYSLCRGCPSGTDAGAEGGVDAAPADCPRCLRDSECSAGGRCVPRACDGLRTCVVAGERRECPTVGGYACPRVYAYDRCTAGSDCGPAGECLAVLPGGPLQCRPYCATSGDCPAPLSGATATAACGSDGRCFLGCAEVARDSCPYARSCQAYATTPSAGFCP